jgi:hypothetical protein
MRTIFWCMRRLGPGIEVSLLGAGLFVLGCDLELRRIPAAGGAAEALVSGYDVIQDIEVDAESMYWIAGGRILRSRR